MIDKSYYNNMSSRNILNDYVPKNLTTDEISNFTDTSLENMVINSNLENQNGIK